MNLFDNEAPVLSAEEILFGWKGTPRIVAVELTETEAILHQRHPDGTRTTWREPFTPWLLTTQRYPEIDAQWTLLKGEGFCWMAQFRTWSEYQSARLRLRDMRVDVFTAGSPERQFLTLSGYTLFQGMSFDDVRRMQVDIETAGLTPQDPSHRVLLMVLQDNSGWSEVLDDPDEARMLQRFVQTLRERDPDVIEGHNLYGFDLPFLIERARRYGITLAVGRSGQAMTIGSERNLPIGAINRPYRPVYIPGRHVVDTYFAVQRYDWAKGELQSYGLKEVARAYGIAEDERVLIDRADLNEQWRSDPEKVRQYALQDVQETARLAEIVLPTEFYQTQMVPDTYQHVATAGSGEKINAIFVRAYLHAGYAIPKPQPARDYPGGYTEVRLTGVIPRVVKADVESLYPSIMLVHRIAPASDQLGVFLPALEELTRRRLEAKAQLRRATDPRQRAYWDGIQGSFKVLINSFYGYLGANFPFNDFDAAQRVTEEGRKIAIQLVEELERTGSRVIEVDTDGVYFQPPEGVEGQEAEEAYVQRIAETLPPGIRLSFDGRYRAMISVKTKNYALLDYEGNWTYKGASLRSRADEPYGRQFIAEVLQKLVEGDREGIARLYRETILRILRGEVPIQELVRRERVTEKTFTSENKRRAAEAVRGVSVGDYVNLYQRADGSLGKMEEYAGDEDREHYASKLYRFALRLREAVGEDFDLLFPRPEQVIREQQQPSLF
ncbi:MAG: DNA polymerase domain-containing protein [Armatimonadota bacterium]|nr:ribonuclease H-like domain-containing protein [Armatimonadota bacterium]MDW8105688.1 DNA polymerase domain-containing protein [Armatimonadota bacterium]